MLPLTKTNKHLITTVLLCTTLCACNKQATKEEMNITPPVASIEKKELTIHGDTRVDNYYWLRNREEQRVIDYLNSENDYTDQILKPTEEFQKKLFDEITGRIQQDDESVPYKLNGYWYISKYQKGDEYPILTRKKESLDAAEEIMVDVNELAKDHDFYDYGSSAVSINNEILAFSEDIVSRRKYTVRFKNLITGDMYEDKILNTTGRVAWANDNKTIFYTRKDETTLRAFQIYKHKLGTNPDEDELVYEEKDELFDCVVATSKSREYIFIGTFSTLSSEYMFLDASNPDGEFIMVQERQPNIEYTVSHHKDKFYVRTNWNAQNFKLMEAKIDNPGMEHWKEIVPHRENVLLEGIEVFDNYLVLEEREDGLAQITVQDFINNREYRIDFGEEAYNSWAGTNMDFGSDTLRYGFTSLTTPYCTVDMDMRTQEKVIKKQQKVIGGYNADEYQSERLMIEARDGVKVPISLVYKKGVNKDGNAPLLLYAYGSYGYSLDPEFSSTRLSLLDRGFIYAIAHIRGGEEMGRQWYDNGKFLKKKNTFNDYIDCADYLVKNKYTSSDHLYAMGGSAGGMLMGGVINMRPDLWNGVVAQVPFVDVVTTMLDESIPLTTGEFEEWGNPKDKEYYEYMKSYSPYDNVEAKDYPNLLVTTGLHDSQVQYWEPAKWVAKLRATKTDQNLLLLKTDMDTGHGGASGRFERYKDVAVEYAFILWLEGILK